MWPFSKPEMSVAVLCTANICRSPAAEALLREHLRRRGLARRVGIFSAGTEVSVPGQPPDPRMVSIGAEQGVNLRRNGSSGLNEALLASAVSIWVMEERHAQQVIRQFPALSDRVALLDPSGMEVSDPYFGDKAGVREVFERLDELCAQRANELASRLGSGRAIM